MAQCRCSKNIHILSPNIRSISYYVFVSYTLIYIYVILRTLECKWFPINFVQAGTVIQSTSLPVVDPDADDTTSFSLDCGTSSSYFTIVASTGVTSFTSDYDVDTETRPTGLTCVLSVLDSGGLSDTADVDIKISKTV